MSSLVITKDSTLKLSFGAFLAIVIYVGGASYWFSEVRQADREIVKTLDKELTRKIDSLTSDLTYASRTFEGYRSRFDRVDDNLQELKVIRHRLDQLERSDGEQERRVHAVETRVEEAQRKIAELNVVHEYIMRYINPPGVEPPKKRNETQPFIYDDNSHKVENVP